MPSTLLAVMAAGALCACAAQAVPLATWSGNPADPATPVAPFIRPANVLAVADRPDPGSPAPSSDAHAAMAGMDMSEPGMSSMSGSANRPAASGLQRADAAPAAKPAQAVGKVNAVDAARRTINLTHQPIAALGWPSMTMDFRVAPSVDLGALKPGEAVTFTLGAPDAEGNRRVEAVAPR